MQHIPVDTHHTLSREMYRAMLYGVSAVDHWQPCTLVDLIQMQPPCAHLHKTKQRVTVRLFQSAIKNGVQATW